MARKPRRKRWIALVGAAVGVLVIVIVTGVALNPTITRYVEGSEFRAEMEKETAKGLHFRAGKYAPIKRTGLLSVATDRFEAEDGRKAMTSLDAKGITAQFNPLGVFLRRWQLDELHIDRGQVGIQIYEPKPEPTPSKPWYHVFLPNRVYLRRVWSDPADVTWRMRDKPGGIFGTHLEITPHGRDFEYHASGGTLRNALIPEFNMRETSMLITRKLFTLHRLELGLGDGKFRGHGTAETRDQKRVDFKADWENLPISPWLPESWTANVAGKMSGDLHWTGNDFKIETAHVVATLRLRDVRVSDVTFLNQMAAIAKRDELKRLRLSECTADFSWDKTRGELKKIVLEEKGKFRIEGAVSYNDESLGGTLQVGFAREYLEWLPKPEEVFPRSEHGYLWTTVHLSGTLDAPQQDLSPRLLDALKDEPFAFLGAALRAFGAWLHGE